MYIAMFDFVYSEYNLERLRPLLKLPRKTLNTN